MRPVLIICVLALTAATFLFASSSLPDLAQNNQAADNGVMGVAEEIERLQTVISDLETTNATQTDQLETLTADRNRLASEKDDASMQLAAANAAITVLNGEVGDERSRIGSLEDALQSANAEALSLTEQLASIKDGTTQASASSNAEMIEMEALVAEMGTALEVAEQRISALQADAEGRIATVSALTDETTAAESEIAALKAEITQLTEAMDEREASVQELGANAEPAQVLTASDCTAQTNAIFEDQRITFDRGTNTIAEVSIPSLEQLVSVAQECADAGLVVQIGGHTDSQGGELSNQTLSENRARAVLDFLYAGGVPSVAMRAVGYGESEPIADNGTSDGRSQNRRITLDWQQ